MTDTVLAAITALTRAVAEYEPEATAAVIASPKQLLSVLLEAARRGLEAAMPHIAAAHQPECDAMVRGAVAAERDRIIALIEAEEGKLRAGAEDADADVLSNLADLIAGSG